MKNDDQQTLESYIQDAWSYWRTEFSRAFVPANYVRIATQNLVITDFHELSSISSGVPRCPENTDLTLQFGYLTRQQKEYFTAQGGNGFISASVRTSYDPVSLQGKGFIYLTADSGPNGESASGTIPMPWLQGNGYLTLHVLRHEFGHVFGLQHQGVGSVMAVDYPEMLVTEGSALANKKNDATDLPFFEVRDDVVLRAECFNGSIQAYRPMWAKFFHVPSMDR
jgi:hypothetical protein